MLIYKYPQSWPTTRNKKLNKKNREQIMGTKQSYLNKNANVALNAFLNPTGPSDAATASLRAKRAADWNAFVTNYQHSHVAGKSSGR